MIFVVVGSVLFCCKPFGLIGLADLGRKDRGRIVFKSSPAVLPGSVCSSVTLRGWELAHFFSFLLKRVYDLKKEQKDWKFT